MGIIVGRIEIAELYEKNNELHRLLVTALTLFEDECTPDERDAYVWMRQARDAISEQVAVDD